jgi:hypothetical protein
MYPICFRALRDGLMAPVDGEVGGGCGGGLGGGVVGSEAAGLGCHLSLQSLADCRSSLNPKP